MIGHALLEAGARRDGDPALVAAGVRAVNTELAKRPSARKVLRDLLAVSAAYRFARVRLAFSPAVRGALPLGAVAADDGQADALDPGIAGCIEGPGCFPATRRSRPPPTCCSRPGSASTVPGAKLADPAGTRADAAGLVGTEAPGALGTAGRSTGPGLRRGLGVINDANTYPLAYDQLSVAMIGDATLALGRGAPPSAVLLPPRARGDRRVRRARQRRVLHRPPPAAVVGPGRGRARRPRGALAFAENAGVAARFRALAAQALARIETVHGIGANGVNVVPRFGATTRGGFRGLDFVNTVVWNGLTAFLLDRAATTSRGGTPAGRPPRRSRPMGTGACPKTQAVRCSPPCAAATCGTRSTGGRSSPTFATTPVSSRSSAAAPTRRWRDLRRADDARPPPDSAGPVLVVGGRAWTERAVDRRRPQRRGHAARPLRRRRRRPRPRRDAALRAGARRHPRQLSGAGRRHRADEDVPARLPGSPSARAATDDVSVAALSPPAGARDARARLRVVLRREPRRER